MARYGRLLFLSALVLFAVAISLLRLFLADISGYRQQFEQEVSRYAGKPVRLSRISASLQGFEPRISMFGVEILDAEGREVLLRFEELRAGLNLFSWVTRGELQPDFVTVVGARFSVRRDVDGSIRVEGLDTGGEMPRWLFRDGHFELLQSQVVWQDLKRSVSRLEFSDVDIRLSTWAGRHRIGINLFLPEEYGQTLSLKMDYTGDLFLPECCDGRIYAEGHGVEYGHLLAGLEFQGYGIHHGQGDFRLWSRWEKSRLVSVAGEIKVRQPQMYHLSLADADARAFFSVSELAARFSWAGRDQTGVFNAERVSVGGSTAIRGLRVVYREAVDASGPSLEADASYLDLARVRLVAQGLKMLDPERHELLERLSPRGVLTQFRAAYQRLPEQASGHFLCARFSEIGINPWKNIPGINRLSGKICGNWLKGVAELDSRRAELSLPGLFRYPILLKQANGRLSWTAQKEGLRVDSDRLELVTPDIATRSRLGLRWSGDSAIPEIDMVLDYSRGHGNRVYRYLPVNVLSPVLVEWLDKALLSGTASGGMVLRGPLDAFPFRKSEGVFEILIRARDVDLMYHHQWPRAHIDAGEIRFYQAGMDIEVERSSILNVPVDRVTVTAKDFDFDDYMNLRGWAHGSIRRMFSVIEKSPLWPDYEPLLSVVELSGNNRLELNLKIPVARHLFDVLVDGKTRLQSAGASAFGVAVSRVNGKLHFTRDALDGSGLKGRFLGKPVMLNLSDLDSGLGLDLSGVLGTVELARHFPSTLWQYLGGASACRVDLKIPKLDKDMYADIEIRTDLRGVRVKLPEPLGKPATARRELRVKTRFQEGAGIPLDVDYGDSAKARLIYSGGQAGPELQRGVVQFGGGDSPAAPQQGLELYAKVPSLNLDPWLEFGRGVVTGPSSSPGARVIDIRTRDLRYSGLELGPLSLRLRKTGPEWAGYAKNRYLDGRISTYGAMTGEPGIEMDLNHLRVPRFNEGSRSPALDSGFIQPASLPALTVRAREFFLRDIPLGKFELLTEPENQRMKIRRLTTRIENTRLNLSGDWSPDGKNTSSSLYGRFEIDDLGRFLAALGKTDMVKRAGTRSEFSLHWRGAPFDFSFESLSGDIGIDFGSGRLLTVEPGFGRVFGLFNLDALKNLLLFDFGQLFGAGLAFDRVKSAFQLADGRATIKQFDVDAVTARITVAGDVDLVGEKLDDIVTVVPKGMMALGASVLINQQLPGQSVDGLISHQYQVTGKWDAPNIVRLPGSGRSLKTDWMQNRGKRNAGP